MLTTDHLAKGSFFMIEWIPENSFPGMGINMSIVKQVAVTDKIPANII